MTKRNKIRSGGCDYELGDIGGHTKNQTTSISPGPFSAGINYLRGFSTLLWWPAMPGRRRSWKITNKRKVCFILFRVLSVPCLCQCVVPSMVGSFLCQGVAPSMVGIKNGIVDVPLDHSE